MPTDEKSDANVSESSPAKFNVLIIDDSKALRRLLAELVSNKFSANIIEAENGKEGLAAVAALNGKIDLIFCDLDMPVMNGETFMKHMSVNEKLKSIPLICLTAATQKETIISCIQLGANEYITKPYNIADVTKKIEKFLKN